MLKHRIIPVLLLINDGLYKTVKFSNPRYIGDPINAVKIFNDKEVDELIFLDITASEEEKNPNFELIEAIASECFMPVCYGGGIKNAEDVGRLFRLGIEKVSINTTALDNPNFIQKIVSKYGNQSVIVSIDVKKDILGNYVVYKDRGRINTKIKIIDWVKKVERLGCGEIFLNSIDRDGTMMGYDLKLLKMVSDSVDIPVIACGGAGKLDDFKNAIEVGGVSAAAAGSMFVYFGKKRGVLINYPNSNDLDKIVSNQ